MLDSTRVVLDLQQVNEIAQSFSGCLDVNAIARSVTDGLVNRFQCAFARIWLLEPDQTMLRLIASSGLYTHTDGFFGRVPMGAYKVGKIAQNRVSFLSNNLPAEPWVGNREWAIANQIRGFAGYPLAIGNRVIGVLAMFSHDSLAPEFLEVLQTLSTIATVALDTAIQHQKEKQTWQFTTPYGVLPLPLSDQLAKILSGSRLTLLGTEQSLPSSKSYLFLRTAEILNQLHCTYARLIYSDVAIILEAIVPTRSLELPGQINSFLSELQTPVASLGGRLETQTTPDHRALQIRLDLPWRWESAGLPVQIRCHSPILQVALTQLAIAAGLTIGDDQTLIILTDNRAYIPGDRKIIWVHQSSPCPAGIQAKVDLSIQPQQLRQAVEAVTQGQTWGIQPGILSERELEVLYLLTQGYRDRDIADHLIISESTVKFHLNNVLSKLKARTRYQAIYQALKQGWI